MSLISENIIPGPNGRIFRTDAIKEKDLACIKKRLFELDGIKNVVINMDVFPKEITIYTSKLVSVEDIEMKVKTTTFHVIPKENIEIQ